VPTSATADAHLIAGVQHRLFGAALAVEIFISGCMILGLVFGGSIPTVLRFVPDDSLFYFTIARNFSTTHRFSYDTLHDTYGFQPLWQIALSAFAFLVEDRDAFFRAGLCILGAFHLITGGLLAGALRKTVGSVAALAAASYWLVNPRLVQWSIAGKENALYALLLVCVLRRVIAHCSAPPGVPFRASGFGALLGLTFLARVNSLLFAGLAAGVFIVAPAADRRRLKAAVAITIGFIAIAGPWLAYAWLVFGTLMPTSGEAKILMMKAWVADTWGATWLSAAHVGHSASLWRMFLNHIWRRTSSLYLPWFVVAVIVFVLSVGLRMTKMLHHADEDAQFSLRDSRLAAFALLATWAVLNSFLNALVLPAYVFYAEWYAVPEVLLLAVVFGIVTAAVVEKTSPLFFAFVVPATVLGVQKIGGSHGLPAIPAGATICAAAFVLPILGPPAGRVFVRKSGGSYARLLGVACHALPAALLMAAPARTVEWFPPAVSTPTTPTSDRHALYLIALWTKEHIPDGVVLGAWDSGIVTYFSGKKVVSLEGLVSDLHFVREGQADIKGYIEENQIQLIWGPGWKTDGSFTFAHLPQGDYRLEWVPFPDFNLQWDDLTTYMLVSPNSERGRRVVLSTEDFSFGHRP
jgi:hypothetical protein